MLALIDGDVMAHMCCERIWYANPEGCFDLVKTIRENNQEIATQENIMKCMVDLLTSLKEISERLFSPSYLMAVKGPDNFRDTIFPAYKQNRHKDPRKMNPIVPIIRQELIDREIAIAAVGREADDMLSIWAYQAMDANEDYVIVSIDKDLKCVPGLHYNIRHKEEERINRIAADRFFYKQLLMGDPTDNIPGILKVGPKKAESALYACATEQEMQEVVVGMYLTTFGESWYDMIMSNGKLLYLQRHEHDYFTCRHWPVVEDLYIPPARIEQDTIAETISASPMPSIKAANDTSHIKL